MNVDVVALLAQAQIVSQEALNAWLRQFDDAYHNGEALITDEVYDQLIRIYNQRFGNYEIIGAPPRDNQIELPYPLYSLDKIALPFDENELPEIQRRLDRYVASYQGPYIVEDKIDGLTGLYTGTGLYTRGDATIGGDISIFIDLLRLPSSNGLTVRGEIVMPKQAFLTYKNLHPEASNPRNTASGLVNSKTIDVAASRSLKYYAYQIMDSKETPEQQIITLRNMGFHTPYVEIVPRLTLDYLEAFVKNRKREAEYDVDGAVFIQNENIEYPRDRNPYHAMAFKLVPPNFLRRVIEVRWEPQRFRKLWPVVYYEPFEYEGTILTKASGKTAKDIIDNGIGPGAIIRVTKGGEIIPDILEVVVKAEPQLPDFPPEDYHWDENHVQLILNYDTDKVLTKKLEYFIKKLEIKDVGSARLEAFVAQGKNTILQLVTATIDDFATLERVGPKTAQKMWDNIHRGIVNVPLSKLVPASGIFESGVSEKRVKAILNKYPMFLHLALLPPDEIANQIREVDGFGEILSWQVALHLLDFVKWCYEHPMITFYVDGSEFVPTVETPTDIQRNLEGIKVIVTGFRGDAEFKNNVAIRGGTYYDGAPTKKDANNTILVAVPGQGHSKIEAARKFNIPIMAREEFIETYFI